MIKRAGFRSARDRWMDARYSRIDIVVTAMFAVGWMALLTGWLCR